MTPRWVVDEAWRDVTSGTTHAVRYGLALLALVVLLVGADLAAVRDLGDRARAFQAAGAATVTVTAPGAVDGAACDALAEVPGVRASGALRAVDVAVVAIALPGAPLAAYDVTPGLADVLHARGERGAGVLLPDEAARTLGRVAGDELATTSGPAHVRATYAWPDDGRRRGFAHAVLVPTPATTAFDECWVDAWPLTDDTWSLAQLAVDRTTSPDVSAELGRVNTTLGTTFDGATLFDARLTRHAGLVALVVGAVLGAISVRARRLELASAQHAGVRRRDQHVQLFLESLAWTVPPVLVTAALVVPACHGRPDEATAYVLAARTGLAAALGALLAVQAATALVREDHLFTYFRNR